MVRHFLRLSPRLLKLKVALQRIYACTDRRILLFPFGNSNAPPNDTVSVYLDYADPKRAPDGWHACAQFALVISNPNDPTIYTVSRMFSRVLMMHSPVSLIREVMTNQTLLYAT